MSNSSTNTTLLQHNNNRIASSVSSATVAVRSNVATTTTVVVEESIASEVLSACLGGAISASILYPLEVLKTQMQAEPPTLLKDEEEQDTKQQQEEEETKKERSSSSSSSSSSPSMWSYAQEMYQTQGIHIFFHGIETSAFQSACEKSLYFFAYTFLKQMYHQINNKNNNHQIGTLSNLLLGYLSEWAHLPITLPLDCWTTQIQTQQTQQQQQQPSPKPTITNRKSSLQLLLILLQKGPSTWYKGIQAYTILCLKPAIQYTVYDQFKTIILNHRRQKHHHHHHSSSSSSSLSAMEAFLLGMLARAVATVVTFPWLRAKVIMQTRNKQQQQQQQQQPQQQQQEPDNQEQEEGNRKPPPTPLSQQEEINTTSSTTTINNNRIDKKESVASLLMDMYQMDGLSSWFQGLGPELTRGVFSAALMLMIKEKIATFVQNGLLLQSQSQPKQS